LPEAASSRLVKWFHDFDLLHPLLRGISTFIARVTSRNIAVRLLGFAGHWHRLSPSRVGNDRSPVTFLTFVNRFGNIPSGSELGTIGHSTGGSSMHAPDLFLTRAAECETMAKIAREADSRAVWTRMAERWHRCAATEMASLAAARQESDRHQRSPAGRNRH
jgi:hypothetical protein